VCICLAAPRQTVGAASVAHGRTDACSVFESELGDVIPVVHASVAGTRIIGRMTVGACSVRVCSPP
jgi:translation initiation factor 6 (eIF-6)